MNRSLDLTSSQCGEQRPRCLACIRHSTECIYFPKERARRGRQRAQQDSPPAIEAHLQPPRSLSPNTLDLNLEDLELLHQYVTSSSVATSQLPQATAQMQRDIPQLAQSHPFPTWDLPAESAIYFSWLRVSQRRYYLQLAAKYHCAALPAFRSVLDLMRHTNHLALIVCSRQLVWCSFAY